VAVPEAAVDKNRPPLPLIGEVWPAGKAGRICASIVAKSHDRPSHNDFYVSALLPHSLHYLPAFFGTKRVA
jgi:hypothetical protein